MKWKHSIQAVSATIIIVVANKVIGGDLNHAILCAVLSFGFALLEKEN